MSDLTKPRSRKEMMLAAISGDYSGKLPVPLTREQEYLVKIAKNGIGSGDEGVDLTEVNASIAALQATVSDSQTKLQKLTDNYINYTGITDNAIDALETLSHTHNNKDVLDGITKNSWTKVEDQTHSHNNIVLLNSISPADITAMRETFPGQIYELQQSLGIMQSIVTVYVNATSGNDENDGSTAATAFATLEKALNNVMYAKKAIIRLAAGTYTIPNKKITITSAYLAIVGAAQSDTIVKGNIDSDNSYLKLFDISLDCTEPEYADTSAEAPIRALSNSSVHLVRASIYTATKYCISATEISNVYCYNVSFSGCTSYAVMLTSGTSAIIYGSADISTKGLCSGAGCRAYLINNSYFTYKSTNYGLVYVNGQQALPQTTETAAVLSMGGNV